MSRGHILVPMGEKPRYHAFEACLTRLTQQGDLPEMVGLIKHQGVSIPQQLNHGIRRMLADAGSGWLWIVGDDHTFAPDIIAKLMAHELPVIVPLTLKRNPPYQGVCYDFDGKPITWEAHQQGVMPIGSAGSAGMLIRRWVLEEIGDPWFTYRDPELGAEDLSFCDKLKAHNIALHVDLDTWMGHITPMEIWPFRDHKTGRWGVASKNTLTMEVL